MSSRDKAARIAARSQAGFAANPVIGASQDAAESAFSSLGQLLGFGGGAGGSGGVFDPQAYLQKNKDVLDYYNKMINDPKKSKDFLNSLADAGYTQDAEGFARFHYDRHGMAEGREFTTKGGSGGSGGPFSSFMNSPFYQAQLESGQRAIASNAALSGRLGSGDTLKAALRYGQNLAGQSLGDYLNATMGIAGLGQNAALAQAQGQQQAKLAESSVWLQPGTFDKILNATTKVASAALSRPGGVT